MSRFSLSGLTALEVVLIPRKYRTHAFLFVIFLLIIIYPQYSNRPSGDVAKAAQGAAENFLQLVDAQEFSRSWYAADELLRKQLGEDEWRTHLTKMREETGPVLKRTQDDMEFGASDDRVPEGKYILVSYETTFKLKGELTERVTLRLDKDKIWRVAGYHIGK